MAQKRKNKSQNNNELNELLIQAVRTGVAFAEKGICIAEEMAHKRDLFKSYPYLDQAFTNVKNVIGFFQGSVKKTEQRKAGSYEGKKRKKRKTSRKKVSKQKTVRHSR